MSLDARSLFDPARPAVEVAELDDVGVAGLRGDVAREHPDAEVRVLRGSRMATLPGLTQELSAALQLPSYVWPGWDSIADGLGEVCNQAARGYLLVVVEAARLLADDEGNGLLTFLDIVTEEDLACQAATRRFRVLLVQPPHMLWELERRLEPLPIEIGRAT